ncbi:hypothetical protein D3C85_1126520 [compost metagenome]
MDEQTYLVDFEWRGRRLTCRIEAASWNEAEERLAASSRRAASAAAFSWKARRTPACRRKQDNADSLLAVALQRFNERFRRWRGRPGGYAGNVD